VSKLKTRTALCCRCFTLPLSPEELWENYDHWVVQDWHSHMQDVEPPPRDSNERGAIEGIEWLIEHMRYIGYRHRSFANYEIRPTSVYLHFYTCDLLNHRTGLCRDYENRHKMCRSYTFCEHPTNCESIGCLYHSCGSLVRDYQCDILDLMVCKKKAIAKLS